jgi:hypothetical protein
VTLPFRSPGGRSGGGVDLSGGSLRAERPPGVRLGPLFVDADATFAFACVAGLVAAPYAVAGAAATTVATLGYLAVRRRRRGWRCCRPSNWGSCSSQGC